MPAGFRPDGLITGASGKGGLPGRRCAPRCHSCGKIAPPAACTAAATRCQPASDRAPKKRGTRSELPADASM